LNPIEPQPVQSSQDNNDHNVIQEMPIEAIPEKVLEDIDKSETPDASEDKGDIFKDKQASKEQKTDTEIYLPMPFRTKLIFLVVGLAIVIFFIGFGAYKYHQKQSFENLDMAYVGSTAKERISFLHSTKMTEVSANQDDGVFVYYYDTNKVLRSVYAEIYANSTSIGIVNSEVLASYKNIIVNKKRGYQQVIAGLTAERTGEATNILYGSFHTFSNSNIHGGVSADFTYTNSVTHKEGKGILIVAFGKDRQYGFLLLADQKLWDNNTVIFNKIISSIAVDQT